ncbi:MAG: hypothetical protein Q4C60_08450 [Eubacteriales bacterium]|nr:hypothetical protein [Eubacteriales bacterium]
MRDGRRRLGRNLPLREAEYAESPERAKGYRGMPGKPLRETGYAEFPERVKDTEGCPESRCGRRDTQSFRGAESE